MKTTLLAMILVGLLFVAPLAAEEQIDIEGLVAEAVARNPDIAVAEAQWQALRHRAARAGSLEDPMLMIGIQNLPVAYPLDFRRDPMTQKAIGISQMIPYRGKRSTRADAARSEAATWRWQLEERKLELAQMVRETAYRLFATDRTLALTESNLQVIDDLIALAETRYAVGQGQLEEVLSAQVQSSRMQERLLVRQRQRQSLEALLNELLDRPQATPVGTIDELSVQPFSLDARLLREQALAERPLLRSLAARHDKNRADQRLAALDYYPDVTLSLEYMQRDRLTSGMGDGRGEDMYSLSLSFNLPVQRAKRRALEQETAAQGAAIRAELHALRNTIESGITEKLAELEQGRSQLLLYREALLPQAEQSLEAALAAYQVNKLTFSRLLERQMALFAYQSDYYEMLAAYHISFAQLQTLVGGSLLQN